jgi:hypothetical protein
VFFVVRGPAPSCEVAGRFSVRGRRGVNGVRFKGRIGRRTLRPGTYTITARSRRGVTLRRLVLVLLPPRGDARAETLDCSSGPSTPSTAATAAGAGSTAPPPAKPAKKASGVLPAIERKLRQVPDALPPLPVIAGSEPGSASWFVGLLALALLALSGLGILVYVVRFVRRPHSA